MAGVDETNMLKSLAAAQVNETIADEKKYTVEEARAMDAATRVHTNSSGTVSDWYEGKPTEEERLTLTRVPGPLPWSAFLVAYLECAERFSYYGCTVVFTNFLQQPRPDGVRSGAGGADGQSGALGKGQQAATGLTTFNQFWVYCTPLLGAYMADKYWGRYKTISVAVGIALVGHILLVVAAIPKVLDDSDASLGIFAVAILIMGLGTGAFKSNISPLIAEQINEQRLMVKTLKNGTKVIQDPVQTASRLFMYFYLAVNVGALIGQVCMVYAEKYVGFWLAFLLPTCVFITCPLILIIGKNRYKKMPPQGSVLGRFCNIFNYAAKQRHWSPKAMTKPGFWDASKPSNVDPAVRPGWMTFDDAWVDEVRRGIAACKVFLFIPIWWLTYNQINNNLTSQAATMATHGLPNDILSNLDPFALIILIPICDIIIYPALRRAGIKFGPVKKIAYGFFTGAAAMVCATVVQDQIYKRSECGRNAASSGCAPVDLNVWAQTPSYVLIAMSEILVSITGLEFAFTKAPKNMRSLVTSVWLFTSAIAAAIGEAFLPISADPLLVWNYGTMAVLAFIAGILFWICFGYLDKEEEKLNDLPTGHSGTAGVTVDDEKLHDKELGLKVESMRNSGLIPTEFATQIYLTEEVPTSAIRNATPCSITSTPYVPTAVRESAILDARRWTVDFRLHFTFVVVIGDEVVESRIVVCGEAESVGEQDRADAGEWRRAETCEEPSPVQ